MPFYLMWVDEITVLIIALIVLGVALYLVRRSARTRRAQSVIGRISALITGAGVLVFWGTRFWFASPMDATWRYSVPLIAATLAIALYAAFNIRPRRPHTDAVREADLSPRSVWTFGTRWWFAGLFTLAGILAATVVLAGLASSVDDQGQYTMIVIDVGSAQAGTVFFGWAFGAPALIALMSLIAIVFLALWRVSRPAVAADPRHREDEFALRRGQTRTVLALSSGATGFALGAALVFVARSSRLAASIPGPDGFRIDLVTSFAALGIPFTVAGLLLQGLGVALVVLPLCQTRGARARSKSAPSVAPAGDPTR